MKFCHRYAFFFSFLCVHTFVCLRACERAGKFYGGREMIVWVQRLQGWKKVNICRLSYAFCQLLIIPGAKKTVTFLFLLTFSKVTWLWLAYSDASFLQLPFFSSFSVSQRIFKVKAFFKYKIKKKRSHRHIQGD